MTKSAARSTRNSGGRRSARESVALVYHTIGLIKGINPAQQVVKIVHDALVDMLGSTTQDLTFGAAPCAWNHVCSSVTQKCVKICHLDPAKDECAPQKCQASSELPQNFGVCVGPLK